MKIKVFIHTGWFGLGISYIRCFPYLSIDLFCISITITKEESDA